MAVRECRARVSDSLDRGEARTEARLDQDRRRPVHGPCLDGRDGQPEFEIVQAKITNQVAVGRGTDAERLHGPRKAIDKAVFDELQGIAFLPGYRGGEWLPQ